MKYQINLNVEVEANTESEALHLIGGILIKNNIFFRSSRIMDGFTLVEILIAMVIVGLVAVVGFPSYFSQIEKNKGQHALTVIKQIKDDVVLCNIEGRSDCNRWHYTENRIDANGNPYVYDGGLTMDNPINNNFTYTYTTQDVTASNPRGNIKVSMDGKCSADGSYKGLC